MLTFDDHPRLARAALRATFPRPLGECTTPMEVLALLRGEDDAACPLPPPTDTLRAAVRDLLRHGSYKPTGRGKPSSEYLARAASEGSLSPINAAVDICNVVSLRSGFPISIVDLEQTTPPLKIHIAPAGRYIFNSSGQELDHTGLLVLSDTAGPCANAVKDAQRTKTTPATRETLTVIWAPLGFAPLLSATRTWTEHLLTNAGASVSALD